MSFTSTGLSESMIGNPTVLKPPRSAMRNLDDHSALRQRLILDQVLHRQYRPARNIRFHQHPHHFVLGVLHRPLLDHAEDLIEMLDARLRRAECGVVGKFGTSDQCGPAPPRLAAG